MFCSMRFYIDKTTSLPNIQKTYAIISMIKDELKLPCNWIEYSLLDPDEDFAYYHHDVKPWDDKECPFSGLPEQTQLQGKDGDASSVIITAADSFPDNQLFDESRIFVWYPQNSAVSLTIKADYKIRKENRSFVEPYKTIILYLYTHGLPVNNSFIHIYQHRNEASILDGGQIGSWISPQSKSILKHYVDHSRVYHLNHIMDVFCANSIQRHLVSEETIEKLVAIIGSDHVWTIEDSIVFSLPDIEHTASAYRITHYPLINKIRELLI